MVKIEQVIVPTKQAGEYLNIVALNFPMNPGQVEFYWQLLTDDTSGICVLDGKLLMNKQTYEGWNSDDSYVVNWACNLLGFKLV